MILITGGAYQGKLSYATAAYSLTQAQVFTCGEALEIDFSQPCIDHIERFTWACVRQGVDPIAYFQSRRNQWQNSVLICQDISCGVVPMEAENRAWREANGRLCQYLSKEACRVSRIFCGLEQRLK